MTPEERLIKAYQDAVLEVLALLQNKVERVGIASYETAVLTDLVGILKGLDETAAAWVDSVVPDTYLKALQETLKAIGVPHLDLIQLHKDAIETLIVNTRADLLEANQLIGRSVQDVFREVQLQAGVKSLSTGGLVDFKQEVLKLLAEKGLTAFTDSAGRNWRPDSYAKMTARTVYAEATNKATENQLKQYGYDLVQVSTHANPCPTCAPYQGRVYSISGSDKRFPALRDTVFSSGYSTIHPNCLHRLIGFVESLKSDKEVREAIKFSGRSFDVDPRTEAQRKAYAAAQTAKRQARDTRLQYERYKLVLGDEAPKTFASFASLKKRDGKAYAKLKQAYREANKEAT